MFALQCASRYTDAIYYITIHGEQWSNYQEILVSGVISMISICDMNKIFQGKAKYNAWDSH